MIQILLNERLMEGVNHEDHNFRSDLLISKSCENACCRRVSEHALRLMHATSLLKSCILQQHQNQTYLSSQTHFEDTDAVLLRARTDCAALQLQVGAGLSLQREVQQLRKELEFHRETIDNYKQLLSDGNSLREELRSELTRARKSASVARAALEQEKRNQIPQVNLLTSVPFDGVSRWLEVYKEENTKLRESIRILTSREMELSGVISRVEDYIKEEVDRLVRPKSQKTDVVFSGSWFMGLLGLLGLPCPSALRYKLTATSVRSPPSAPRRQPSKRCRRNSSVSKPLSKHSSALESILSELDEACADAAVQTPDKRLQQRSRTFSPSASSSTFVKVSRESRSRKAKRLRRDNDVSSSPPTQLPAKDAPGDVSLILSQKSRKLPEIGMCFSLSDQKKSRRHDERQESLRIPSFALRSDVQSLEQIPIENVSPPLQKSTVDLDEMEASPVVENQPFIESGFSSPVLRPSSPTKPHKITNGEVEPEEENSLEKNGNGVGPPEKNPVTKSPQLLKTFPHFGLSPTDRVQTRPTVAATRQKKPLSPPTSLAEIITAKFSKAVFNWFNDITTYEIVKMAPLRLRSQVAESKPVSPPPMKENRKEDTPRKLSIPLGSCVGMESGIISTPQPQSLLEGLTAHFAGQRAFSHPSTSNISMDVVCEALIQALELVPSADTSLTSPPDPVFRAASLLKAVGMPQDTSAFTLWFRVRLHVKKKRRFLPRTSLQIYRLAQAAFLTCDPSRRSDLLYQLATFLSFNEYSTTPISCLLLASYHVASTPMSSLDSVYQFLAWKEAEESADVEFVSTLRNTSCWSSTPTVTSLRDLVSDLVDNFCYARGDNADDNSRALLLILTAHAFTDLEVKKSSTYRFGLVGWLLRARLINWINALVKSVGEDSTLQLILRVCSLSIDVILLTVQLDLRRSSTPSNKKLSACQRGVLACCERLFEVLLSLLPTSSQHLPLVVFCLLRLVPCLTDDQTAKLSGLLRDLPTDDLSTPNAISISSILPPLQSACISRSFERLQIPSAQPLAHWMRRILSSFSPPNL
ncbi:hypothetical protein ECG_08536 [Echinococcus granulosus]|uniref:Peptidyl prolyl cis trans isomerase h ppih n=1 Tax=Echinococcus granulosus TaxID=6210 RepID=U6JEM0_ECHGR|nr:hypothetical protein EGR_03892 [Echinococcus granulosus]EUB61217.1 hypothetical protein EGR_03892 [Echinococcus granulosus]KAH9279274.1 hypothetical protein ECG_08536 [Echinococcus granulosus]CDS20896.1 peptidyl prolyl cis trans isomerase h ppih [Echinococcus granulosus]